MLRACFLLLMLSVVSACASSDPVWQQGFSVKRPVHCVIKLNIRPSVTTDKLLYRAVVPQSLAGRQSIHSIDYSIKPTRFFNEEGVKIAEWVFVKPRDTFVIQIDVKATIYRRDRALMTTQQKTVFRLSDQERQYYLKEEQHLDLSQAKVKQMAAQIKKGVTVADTARNIHDAVKAHMAFGGYDPIGHSASVALKERKGDCTEYSRVFVALCRVKGIPARVIAGVITKWSVLAGHNWAEYYDENLGWVPVDVLHAQSEEASFDRLQNKYLQLSHILNYKQYPKMGHWFYEYWGGKVQVRNTLQFKDTGKDQQVGNTNHNVSMY